MPRARVILATYNQASLLKLALRGFLRQTSKDFSLCIADDGSSDDTRDVVAAFRVEADKAGIPVEHVWQEDHGFRKSSVLNEAVRRATDEHLYVFADGDCIPPAHFVQRHLHAHFERTFHVGGVAWLTEAQSRSLTEADVDAGTYESWVSEEAKKDFREKRRKSLWGMRLRRRNRPKVQGANMAFDRTIFEALNGFDEAYEGWGYEDSDIRTRAMSLRPRPIVRLLYGKNDVFHLHPLWRRKSSDRTVNRAYYKAKKPARCAKGLVDETPRSSRP